MTAPQPFVARDTLVGPAVTSQPAAPITAGVGGVTVAESLVRRGSLLPKHDAQLSRGAMVREAGWYAGATYLARGITAMRSLINARWLGPELYGFWGSVSLILTFGFYVHGGVQPIVAKEIAGRHSRGDHESATKIAQVAWTFFVAMLAMTAALIWLFAGSRPSSTPALQRLGWIVAGIVLPLEVLQFFEQTVMRSQQRFHTVSYGIIITSLVSLTLTAWLVVRYGIVGLFLAAVVTPLLGLWWLRRTPSYAWRVRWSWDDLRPMLQAGWPVLAMTIVFESMIWIDRALVLGFIGVTGFGYYALAAMLAQCCVLFPEAVALIIEPKLYAAHAAGHTARQLEEHVWLPWTTLAWLMPVALAAVDLLLPPFVSRVLPAYTPALPAMRVLIWGAFFYGLSVCSRALIIALGQQRRVLLFYGAALCVHLLVSVPLLVRGWGLTGVAVGTVIAHAVCCSLLLLFALRQFGLSGRQAVASLGRLYLPLAAVLAAVVVAPWLISRLALPSTLPWPLVLKTIALGAFGWMATWRIRRRLFDQGFGRLTPALVPESPG